MGAAIAESGDDVRLADVFRPTVHASLPAALAVMRENFHPTMGDDPDRPVTVCASRCVWIHGKTSNFFGRP